MTISSTDLSVKVPVTVDTLSGAIALTVPAAATVSIPVTMGGNTTTLEASMQAALSIGVPMVTSAAQVALNLAVADAVNVSVPISTGASRADGFETVAKNLRSYAAAFGYTGADLTSIEYTAPAGTITKTLTYTAGKLTAVTLAGALPANIATIKTLTYAGDDLQSITYN